MSKVADKVEYGLLIKGEPVSKDVLGLVEYDCADAMYKELEVAGVDNVLAEKSHAMFMLGVREALSRIHTYRQGVLNPDSITHKVFDGNDFQWDNQRGDDG